MHVEVREARRGRRSLLVFASFIGGMLAMIVGVSLTESLALGILWSALAVLAPSMLLIGFWIRGYRCDECGARLLRIEEARPARKYHCPRCEVVWNLRNTAGGEAAAAPVPEQLPSVVRERLAEGLDSLAASPVFLLAAAIAVNALLLPYRGLTHDAVLYGFQTLNHVSRNHFAQDLYLRFGSQDRYTIFSLVAAGWVRMFGLPLGFFLLYLLSNTSFLWAVQRLVFAIVPSGRLAVIGTLAVAGMTIPFGGWKIFHANESFLTPRIFANALVLFALERMIRGRLLATFVLLAAALLMHPLMGFGGLLIAVGWCLARWLPFRWLCVLAALAALLLLGLMVDVPLATRLLGSMDDEWRAQVLAVNSFNSPWEWQSEDWLRIGAAVAVALMARASLPVEARSARLFLAVTTATGLIGIAGSVLAGQIPYALPLQGQPYRVLWLLQLLEVPLGVFLIPQWWRWEGPWGRILAVSWAATWFMDFSPLVLVLVPLCLVFMRRRRDVEGLPPRSTDWAFNCLWLSVGTMVLIGRVVSEPLLRLWVLQGNFVHIMENLKQLRVLLEPLNQVVTAGLAIWVCSWPYKRTVALGLTTGGLLIACGAFVVASLGIGKDEEPRPQALAFVKQYLAEHHHGPVPAVYWPVGFNPKPLWFDLGVNCYFDWHQNDGNLFSRDTALEGRRRARLVQRFEMARFRELFPNESGRDRVLLERKAEAPWDLGPPSEADLRRLCAEADVDYLVLRQPFGKLYIASGADWYLYDCRQLRAGAPQAGRKVAD